MEGTGRIVAWQLIVAAEVRKPGSRRIFAVVSVFRCRIRTDRFLLKGLAGQFVEGRTLFLEELSPEGLVPDFEMVMHAEQDDLLLQAAELHEPLGNPDAALAVYIHAFGL